MQYIPIEVFLKLFPGQTDQNLLDNYDNNIQKLQLLSDEDLLQLLGSGSVYSKTNLLESYLGFQQKETLIFHQWIAQSSALKAVLTDHKLVANDLDKTLNPEHFLYTPFSNFISPLLLNRFMPFLDQHKNESTALVSTYLPVLNKDAKLLIQQKIAKNRDLSWFQMEEKMRSVKDETELIRLVGSYFSDEQIQVLNRFDKSHYSSKIQLIDRGMLLFEHAKATHRIAYWIINQLNKLNLNAEHKERIKEVHNSIKRGDSNYFKRKSAIKGGFSTRSAIWIGIGLVLIVGVWIIGTKFPHLLDQEVALEDQQSSFQQFTKEERMQLDSLIKTMEKTPETEDPIMDQGTAYLHLTPVSITLVDRDPLQNEKVERFIQDTRIANQLAVNGKIDSCSAYSNSKVKYLAYPDFQKLSQSSGSKTLFFKNESAFQVLVVLFDEQSRGKAFASVLLPDQELKFQADANMRLMILPGSDLGGFYCSKNASELPSKSYKHHFCYTDQNFEAQLYKSYLIDEVSETTIKILLNQTDQDQFYIVDIYKALRE